MGFPTLFIANWKMHKTVVEAKSYFASFFLHWNRGKEKLFFAVPYTAIREVASVVKEKGIFVGAQNVHTKGEGAYTGEISASMLKEAGASFSLIGHSERRHFCGEKNETIQKKVERVLVEKITPILCIGETKQEREEGKTDEVLFSQLEGALPKRDGEYPLIIAYEPVWAIGSGKTPLAKEVEESHSFIKKTLKELLGESFGSKVAVLYGGSVTPKVAPELLKVPGVDGLLVGGASLDPEVFAQIIDSQVEAL